MYQAKEFAERAGVSVRTLHLYDREGLLKPARRTESGYRLYGEDELERLEQIVALRFIGLGLEHIKSLLAAPAPPLLVALRAQREIIAAQRRKLEAVTSALEAAERALSEPAGTDRWKTLCTIIEVFRMNNDWEWTQKYYTEEDREKLAQRMQDMPNDVVTQGQRDWAALIAEVEEAAANAEDPHGSHAATLTRRWNALIEQFTGGDAGVRQGLNRLWSDTAQWPAHVRRPVSDAANAFIKEAMRAQ